MLFIYNPKSGTGRIKNHLAKIVEIFAAEEYEINIHPTQYVGDATHIVEKQSPSYDLVVCSGGDGTLDEVVSGMMKRKKKIPIGYIPSGSTNDFANSLGIPKNMVNAAIQVMHGKSFLCDIGSFDEKYFLYVAAFGIFTEVSYETDQEMKNKLGHLAYILEATLRLPQTKFYRMKISSMEKQIEGEFLFGMISNSNSIGGIPNLTAKQTELNDGVFEVTLIKKPKSTLEINRIMTALLQGDVNNEMIICFKTKEITFEAMDEVPWTLDGEFGGRKKTVTIKNLQEELELIVPE